MAQQPKITVYGNECCSYCLAARLLLKKKGLEFEDILVTSNRSLRDEMERLSGSTSVPQIFIDGVSIGGFDELYVMDQKGELDRLVARGVTAAND